MTDKTDASRSERYKGRRIMFEAHMRTRGYECVRSRHDYMFANGRRVAVGDYINEAVNEAWVGWNEGWKNGYYHRRQTVTVSPEEMMDFINSHPNWLRSYKGRWSCVRPTTNYSYPTFETAQAAVTWAVKEYGNATNS